MILNGKRVEQEKPILVLDFVRSYRLSRHVVRISINGKRIHKEDFDTTYIQIDDHVIFTSLVSGG